MGAKAVALLNHPHDAPFGGLIGEQYQSNHAEPDKRGGPDGIRSCIKDVYKRQMELFVKTLLLLRKTYRFFGYIHVKVIPGADQGLVQQAVSYTNLDVYKRQE